MLFYLSIYYTWKHKRSYKNNKFKISAPAWNKEFQLLDGSYSLSDIQYYFEYIIKKHKTVTGNPLMRIFVNKIENRITFKIKTGYYLELSTPKTMKLLGSTKIKINKSKNAENMPHLEITKVVLIFCNIVNNDYQQDSRVLYTFVCNTSSDQLLDVSSKDFIFSKVFNTEFSYIVVWFTDQNLKPLEMKDKINITLVLIKV